MFYCTFLDLKILKKYEIIKRNENRNPKVMSHENFRFSAERHPSAMAITAKASKTILHKRGK